jgi:hypothetical protein
MDAQLQGSEVEGAPGTVVPPTCPFFRSVAIDGALRAPIEVPDGANRCAAFGRPRPQSPLQQELVCLTSDHVECPRYVQGTTRVREAAARRERARRFARPTTAAIGFLVLSAAASFAFVISRGGLTMPTGAGPAGVAGASASAPVVAVVPTEGAPTPSTPVAVLTPEPTIAATPPPTTEPTLPPTPSPTAPPTPTPSPTPSVEGLEPCSDQPDCFVYIVQSGDSLWAIGQRFGHSLETVREWNPWTESRGLRPGAEILLPPPNV